MTRERRTVRLLLERATTDRSSAFSGPLPCTGIHHLAGVTVSSESITDAVFARTTPTKNIYVTSASQLLSYAANLATITQSSSTGPAVEKVRPPMPAIPRRDWQHFAVIVFVCAGCATTGRRLPTNERIADILGQQSAAWNSGDIEEFMQAYWRSPKLTFSSGGRVTRGWKSTLDHYRIRYPTRETMGHLTFSNLEVLELGDTAALVLGRWRLQREAPVGGAFTLIFRRVAGRWVIIHDHTSRDAP